MRKYDLYDKVEQKFVLYDLVGDVPEDFRRYGENIPEGIENGTLELVEVR